MQLLESEYFLFSVLLCDDKLNIFKLRTKRDIWGLHLREYWSTFFPLSEIFIARMDDRWISNDDNHYLQLQFYLSVISCSFTGPWYYFGLLLEQVYILKRISVLILSSAASLYPPSVWNFVLDHAHLNTQSALIGQLTQAWASTSNNNRGAVLNQFLCAKLPARLKLSKCVTWWCGLMSQSHKIICGTIDEAFEEQCFLWERGASVGALTFYMQKH